MSTPRLINLPPPPSNPETPSDMGPGTPNSGTTSLSALSTTAIKDGQQGHAPPHSHHHATAASRNTLDAERADRISRLAGLERVATARQGGSNSQTSGPPTNQPSGYFEGATPGIKERSTIGSASATGSVGGITTWASGSDVHDADKMSEEQDDGVSSTGALSDEGNASLVGFGEGASSTISGPISSRLPSTGKIATVGSPIPSRSNASTPINPQSHAGEMSGVIPTSDTQPDERMTDGTLYDSGARGSDLAEDIMRDSLGDASARPLGSPDEQPEGRKGLGKFSFERK